MLLVIAVLFLAAAVFAFGEAATYPAALKERSIRRAADYGRVRVPKRQDESLRFHERVVAPASHRLAAHPAQAQPEDQRRRDRRAASRGRPVAAASRPRTTSRSRARRRSPACSSACSLPRSARRLAVIVLPLSASSASKGPTSSWTRASVAPRRGPRALPDALDLLAVSVEAGLGFDGAITKLTDHMTARSSTSSGSCLRGAHGRVSPDRPQEHGERVGAPELSAFVRAVVQADQLGISLGRILRVQAADSRLRRQAAAEEKAMKAPIKMLFPTVLFIFPSMFVVVLGPALLNIMSVLK